MNIDLIYVKRVHRAYREHFTNLRRKIRKLLSISVGHEFGIITHVSQGFNYDYFRQLEPI